MSGELAAPVRGEANGRQFFLLMWAHFLNDGSANYLPGVLPAILVALREPASMAGVIMAALLIGQTLQPLTGVLADRVGGRAIFIVGLLGSSVGGALVGFSQGLWSLILCLLAVGIGNSLFHPQALAIVRNVLKSRREGLGMSGFLVGGELGRGVFPMVTSFLVTAFGIASLWVLALPALATAPFLAVKSPALPRKPHGAARVRWKEHLGPMAVLVAFASLRSLLTYGVVTFVPVMWHLRGGSLVVGASIVTTVLVVGIPGNLAGGHLADRIGRRRLLMVSMLVAAALVPWLPAVRGAVVWIVAGLLGVALFSGMPVTILVGQDIFPENRSMGSGIALGLANGVGALLVLAVGLLVPRFGVEGVLWLVAVSGFAAAALALKLPEGRTDSGIRAHA